MKILKRSLLSIIALTVLIIGNVDAVNYGDVIALKSNRESWLTYHPWDEQVGSYCRSMYDDYDTPIMKHHEDFGCTSSPSYQWTIVSIEGKTGQVNYGDRIALKAGGKYLSAKDENAACMVDNVDKCELWTVVQPENAGGALGFKDWNGNHLCCDDGGRVVSNRGKAASWEKWWPVKQ